MSIVIQKQGDWWVSKNTCHALEVIRKAAFKLSKKLSNEGSTQ